MWNSLRILLIVGAIFCVLPVVVSADLITDADVFIDFIIDDGNPTDLHDENGWLVAGSGISSTVSATYTGNESLDVNFVRFTSVEKDTYGDVSEGYVSAAPYETVFPASKNRAGNAPILVEINYSVNGIGYDYNRTVDQKIDHNVPMKIQSLDFKSEVTINGTMEINLMMEDAYGNTVNSLYEDKIGAISEEVTFSTTSYAGSGFLEGIAYSAELVCEAVNADGSVVVNFKVGTEAGPKYLIHMVPPMFLSDKWLTITALADAEPYAIAVSVVPDDGDTPHIPADGESKFYLTYHLFDRYGNPSGNQTLHFKDSVFEDEFTQWTNSDGEVKLTFGPFERVDLFNIHAYAVGNISVTIDQELQFTSTAPVDMLLTANPEFMPSADVAPEFNASLLAKVIDESGNGVPGQEVEFLIRPRSYDGNVHDGDPFLNGIIEVVHTSATTNANGTATVNFTPGGLLKNVDGENKITPAFENCTVEATWTNVKGDIQKKRTILLTWMNYPYLRVETEVNPELVNVGDSVNVTIRLIGDGYALHPDPIDVMLCVDRSGSMDEEIEYSDGSSTTRMNALKSALNNFNTQMTETTDQVGMVSFGYKGDIWIGGSWFNPEYKTYSDYATKDLSLTPLERTTLNETIDSLISYSGTPMRSGLYKAIKELVDNPHADAVQAVILLSDGDYNWYGDPLARGSAGYLHDGYWYWGKWYPPYWVWYDDYDDFSNVDYDYYWYDDLAKENPNMIDNQSMSVYAANNNIKIYSISFGDDISVNGTTTLETLAKSTGGKYYDAPSATELAAIYTKIAGELKTEAGVNTTMDLKFTNIELNNVSVVNNKTDPFLKYEYVPGISTQIKSWNEIGSEDKPNVMNPPTLDQSKNWEDNQSLNFNITDVGTIHLGQTWQAVFRLNVLREGNINVFGKGSLLSFNNGDANMTLPKTYITAAPLNTTGINFTDLEVTDLVCVEANESVITDYLTMEWNLSYSGNYAVTQYLYYQNVDDGFWTMFGMFDVGGPVSEDPHTKKLYVADFPPGKYKLRVRAMANDAPDSVIETVRPIVIGQGGQYFIRLE